MGDKGGASIKEALMGLIVTMVADLNMTIEDIKKAITIIDESPFIKIDTVEKYKKIYEGLKDWIMAFVDVGGKTEDFTTKIAAIPDKAQAIADGAKDELASAGLGVIELMKVVKGTINSVSKIKEVCKTLLEQIKGIPKEI